MFDRRTVLILGAGASWHYGFPTGETLVSEVIKEAERLASFYKEWAGYGQWLTEHAKSYGLVPADPYNLNRAAQADCQLLANKLRASNPPVIDYFLAQNPSLQDTGRLLIALVILGAETDWLTTGTNKNRGAHSKLEGVSTTNDDWCRFIIARLSEGCRSFDDVLKQPFRVITFNYDVSFERRLFQGLQAQEVFDGAKFSALFEADRIIHMYGQVGAWNSKVIPKVAYSTKSQDSIHNTVRILDAVYAASKSLCTIDPADKGSNSDLHEEAKYMLGDAAEIFVLGFGFDVNNCARLGLDAIASRAAGDRAHVYFTNFGDIGRVNLRASSTLIGDRGGIFLYENRYANCVKSTTDVYHALCNDFELGG